MKLFIKRFISIYVVLFTTSFPIHFDSWLNFPFYIAYCWEVVNQLWMNLFDLSINSPILSDSKGLYIQLISLFIISALSSVIWVKFSEEENKLRNYYFRIFVSYYLALQLIVYGLNKLFLLQFPQPTTNILFTNVGEVSKDLLFWTSMGASPMYNYFMGGIELLAAVFLLFFRTRLLGALLSIGIFLNIVFINFSFDISVKVYSLFLLFLSAYLVSPYLEVLYKFFIKHEQTKIENNRLVLKKSNHKKIALFIKGVIIFLFFFIGSKPYLDAQVQTLTSMGLSEAYLVIDFKINGNDSDLSKYKWKRVYFHPRSYFIVENNLDKFLDYELEINTESNQLILNNKTILNYQILENGNLKMFGIWNSHTISIILAPIKHKDLPLLKEQFHWTID